MRLQLPLARRTEHLLLLEMFAELFERAAELRHLFLFCLQRGSQLDAVLVDGAAVGPVESAQQFHLALDGRHGRVDGAAVRGDDLLLLGQDARAQRLVALLQLLMLLLLLFRRG